MTWPTSAFARAFAPSALAAGQARRNGGASSFPLIAAGRKVLGTVGRTAHLGWLAALQAAITIALLASEMGGAGLAGGRASLVLMVLAIANALALTAISAVGNRTAPVADTTATPGQTVQATPIARASLANLAPLAGPAAIDGFGQLLQRVSHELRTPLNAVIGFSDLMQREMLGPLGDARYVEYAGHIRSSGSELLKATEDTLALTTLMGRADAPRRDVYPLANLMQDVGTRVGARPAHHAALVDVTVDRDCEVMVDRRVLVQAIVNVTSALLRHAPAGTSVTIAAIERADTVELRVMPSRPASGEVRDALEMCLARTLLVLAGLGMSEDHATGDCMGIIVHVPAAAQSDLFDAPVARS